jgi:hypothetical protein
MRGESTWILALQDGAILSLMMAPTAMSQHFLCNNDVD